MQQYVENTISALVRTPRTLQAWLIDLDECWTHANYGPDTFSPYDVVGHLIHGEKTDWMPRIRIILENGESQPFDPFDRCAMLSDSEGKSMANLLDEFAELRKKNLADLNGLNLTANQLSLTGTHPELGVVTIENLLAAWVVHDLHHIAQIARALAYQHRKNVGPFRDYFGILPKK